MKFCFPTQRSAIVFINYRRLSSKTRDEKETGKTTASSGSFEMDSTKSPWRYNLQQQTIHRHRIPRTGSHDSIVSSISRNVAPVHNEFSRYCSINEIIVAKSFNRGFFCRARVHPEKIHEVSMW